jgi:hypothetical protein
MRASNDLFPDDFKTPRFAHVLEMLFPFTDRVGFTDSQKDLNKALEGLQLHHDFQTLKLNTIKTNEGY